MAQYSEFAPYYDTLIRNVDYAARAAYFDRVIQKFGGSRGILLDVACGTGSLWFELEKLGYDVIGAVAKRCLALQTRRNIVWAAGCCF